MQATQAVGIDEAQGGEGVVSGGRAFLLHLWAYVLPLLTLAFLLTGPHSWQVAVMWMLPIWVLVLTDVKSGPDLRQPDESTPKLPFNIQVWGLTFLQLANHVLLGVMASKLAIWPAEELGKTIANLVAMHLVCGINAGYSGIVLAHELVHRRNRVQYFLGRLLLVFVLYEHFATEHVRGHHPRVGTRQDPATARFGETFRDFLRRTVPAQFMSAWALEKKRIGEPDMSFFDLRMVRHRVLQGLVMEAIVLAGFFYFFGWLAAVFFIFQARTAALLLEVVNYIEHWGLTRVGKTVTNLDSWDTDNWFTLHTLVGLSRHSDHHARASRPYHMLRRFEESPKMPSGYYGTIVLALLRNERYQELATEELRKKKLGPFREQEGAAETGAASVEQTPGLVGAAAVS
ncbi:MAG: alkane 1-monooxygenase [Myxococcales bacterium]|nr:alkane 1-monooxygenase [Myxococcales bacterium]